ncbi:MAG: ABC transporter permease, partial [Thermoanaerobaculia bacterium]
MNALLAHEIRTILLAIRRRPLVPMLAIAILALAIGANVAVFTVLSRTLLRPLRYRDASRLLQIPMSHIEPDRTETASSSNSLEVVQWNARTTMFTGVEAARQLPATLTGSGDPESVDGADVTGGLFRLLGVAPAIGRDFAKSDDVPDTTAAIISYGLWQRRFASDRKVIGKPITVNGRRLAVIGVMPRDFEVPTVSADVFVPAGISPSNMANPNSWNFTAFGRLRDGVSPKQGEADLRRISGQLQREYPGSEKEKTASVQTLRKAMFGDRRAALLVLWAAVTLVQILACVNVANLLFARISDQRGVAALRLVLGADRLQMMRLRFLEGAIISAAGTIIGFIGGSIALRLLVANQPDLATAAERAWTMPLFLVATALATALVISIVPAFRESGVKLSTVLNEGSQRASSSVRGSRAREWFIVCQIALAIPLLLAATGAVEHFRALQRTDIGFDADHVLTGQLILPDRYADKSARAAFAKELMRRIAAIPGVTSAAITTNLFTSGNSAATFAFTDRYPEPLSMALRRITPDYFKTMRIALSSGRNIT